MSSRAIAALLLAPGAHAFVATPLGSFPCRAGLTAGPGFAEMTGAEAAATLIISQFGGDPLEKDFVAAVPAIGALLAAGNVSRAACEPVASVVWPNDVGAASIGGASGLLAPGGFLVPPKTIGAITFLNWTVGGPPARASVLSAPKVLPGDGWFMHRAVQFDIDGDGRLDVLAARATKPLVEAPAGELFWLRAPAGDAPLAPAALPWAEAVLASGKWAPDVLFAPPVSLRADADEQIYYTSFFTGGGLGMVECKGCARAAGGTGTWAAAAPLTPVVLDASLGPSFDVATVDINGDGRLDVLATNHVDNATMPGATSLVVAYEAPRTGPLSNASAWTRHVLAAGFAIREPGPNQAAPGGARAFSPPGGGARPWVSVSGDGDQHAYVLVPTSSDPASWDYERVDVLDCKGTVGRQVHVDVGGAAFMIVPCYDSGRVYAFRLDN
jgi:hypothetical protein